MFSWEKTKLWESLIITLLGYLVPGNDSKFQPSFFYERKFYVTRGFLFLCSEFSKAPGRSLLLESLTSNDGNGNENVTWK